MVRRALLALALTSAALLGGAVPAGAQSGPFDALRAHAGWLSWFETRHDARGDQTRFQRVLERRRRAYPFPRRVFNEVDLGPGPDGRTVATYARCTQSRPGGPASCAVIRRDPVTRRERALVGPRRDFAVDGVAQHRGTLALVQRLPTSRLLLRPAGAARFRTLARGIRASRLDLEPGLLAYRELGNESDRVRVVDLRRARPRFRTIAADSTYDYDCRCSQSVVSILDATLDGRHAYWIESTARSTGPSPIGSGAPGETTTRILRADVLARDPAVEVHVPHGDPHSLAVSDGRLHYDTLPDFRRGVRPRWERTDERVPVRT